VTDAAQTAQTPPEGADTAQSDANARAALLAALATDPVAVVDALERQLLGIRAFAEGGLHLLTLFRGGGVPVPPKKEDATQPAPAGPKRARTFGAPKPDPTTSTGA
jgi:hypothetical protein